MTKTKLIFIITLSAVLIFVIIFLVFTFIKPRSERQIIISNSSSAKSPKIEESFVFDDIFTYKDPKKLSQKDQNLNEYTLIATGDIIPARSVNFKLTRANDFIIPYKETVGFLKSADIVFADLESSLISGCNVTVEGMMFCGDERNIQGLKFAGVTIANIANNHAGNYGIEGITNTINLLNKNNILVTGDSATNSAIINIRGKKFGFLGYNDIGAPEPGISWADIPTIEKQIKDLKKNVDFVITTFHWGVEYTSTPSARQIELAHTAIDAGADLIIGNHPHWVQGLEQYKGKYITYAHGNYVFDQMWSKETREGVLGKYTFNDRGVIRIEFAPVIIDDYSKARFANLEEAQKILNDLKSSSESIAHLAK